MVGTEEEENLNSKTEDDNKKNTQGNIFSILNKIDGLKR